MNIPQLKRMLWVMNEIIATTPHGGITRQDLNNKWQRSSQNDYDGKAIAERTFYRIIDSLEELFECEIPCSAITQKYSIKINDEGNEQNDLTLLEILLRKNTPNSLSQVLQMIVAGNDIPANDMRAARDLSAAISRLPQLYSEQFLCCAKKIKGIDRVEEDGFYRNYVCIWNETLYLKTRQWLSIGFYDKEVCFYLVTDEQNAIERTRKAAIADFGEGVRYRGGYYWHEPLDSDSFIVYFEAKPDMQDLIRRAEMLQSKLEKVNP